LFLQKARQFYEAINRVADIVSWRHDENIPTSHWWWYLDVIVLLPADFLATKATHSDYELSPTGT